MTWSATDNLFVASTYKAILHSVAAPVLEKAELRLNCNVQRITASGEQSVRVAIANGFEETYNEVIVTAPLGWLKRNEKKVFSPHLPAEVSDAIHALGYGNLDRVFVRFPSTFWNDQQSQVEATLEAKSSRRPAFPIESLFLNPSYATDMNPARWRQEIISFSGLPAPHAQPIIMFFVYGQWGRYITGLVRGMPPESAEYQRILDAAFEPYYSKLPCYSSVSPDCKPSQIIATDWQNDEFAGFGSFTNLPVNSGDCSAHIENLREGIGETRGIWFAGEHTSPLGGLGTVHGAYWSGGEVADRICQKHGVSSSTKSGF